MSTKNLRLRLSVGAILATASLGGIANAQEKETLLEEIIVTAERREQSLQEVPLSITAFGDQQREVIGILSIQDMANFAPGVSYTTNTDRPSIRGIARQSNSFSLDSPVANYFDGVYTSSVQDAQRRPLFIERTEILRGPQGALSGRGSIAGAINTISKRPKDEFGAEVRVFGGSYERLGAEGTVTGGITDWFRMRVNLGKYQQDKGYFDNVATGKTEGDQPNNRTVQDYILEFDLGESVDLFLKAAFANYDETRRTGYSTAPFSSGYLLAPTAYGPSSGTLTPLAGWGYFSPYAGNARVGTEPNNPVLTTGDVRKFSNDFQSRQTLDDHHNYTAHLTWHASSFDVKWIGGHQNYLYTQQTDNDFTDVTAMTLPGGALQNVAGRVVDPHSVNIYAEEREWYSNELTLTSTGDGAFSWIAGVYQSKEEYNQAPFTTIYRGYNELNNPLGTVDRLLQILGGPVCNGSNAAFCYNPSGIRPIVANPLPNASVASLVTGETTSSAVFGQVDYKLNDQWKFTVGARYNEDEKEVTEAFRYIANSLGNGLGRWLAGAGLGAPASVDVTPSAVPAVLPAGVVADYGIDPTTGYRIRDMKNKWDALTGSVGIDFTPIDDHLLYLRLARGYRPGGFNSGFLNDPPMVDQEQVDSYELGYKATFFNQLQLSSSVFYYDYQDIQLPLPTLGRCTNPDDLSTCTILNSFVNLPAAETMGLELEANWAATEELSLYLSYGYLDAKIKNAMGPGSNGYSNPDDPAAIFPNANRYAAIPNQLDSNFTFLQRYTQDLSGNKLANSPEHRVAFNVNYTFHFGAGDLVASSSFVWRDEQYSDVFESEIAKVPSYSTVGARLIWTDSENRYSVMLYGTNLTDEDAADGASVTRLGTGIATSAGTASEAGAVYFPGYNLAPPREFGLELQYRLGGAR